MEKGKKRHLHVIKQLMQFKQHIRGEPLVPITKESETEHSSAWPSHRNSGQTQLKAQKAFVLKLAIGKGARQGAKSQGVRALGPVALR